MIILELTENEALSLRNLLDVAVRAEGMRAAEFALHLDRKVMAAANQASANQVAAKPAPTNGKPPVEAQEVEERK